MNNMNLDEMLAASGISGGAAAVNGNTKSGFVTFIGRPYEQTYWTKDCYYI